MMRVGDLVSSSTSGSGGSGHSRHGHRTRNAQDAHDDHSAVAYGGGGSGARGNDIDSTTEPIGNSGGNSSSQDDGHLLHMAPPPTPGAMVVSSTTNIPSVMSHHEDNDENSVYDEHEDIDSTTEPVGGHAVAYASPHDEEVSYQENDHHAIVDAYYPDHASGGTNHVQPTPPTQLQLYLQHSAETYQNQSSSYMAHQVSHHPHLHQQVFDHHHQLEQQQHAESSQQHELSVADNHAPEQQHYSHIEQQELQMHHQAPDQNFSHQNEDDIREDHGASRIDEEEALRQAEAAVDAERQSVHEIVINEMSADESRVPRAVLPESYMYSDAMHASSQQHQASMDTSKGYLPASVQKKLNRAMDAYTIQPSISSHHHFLPHGSQLHQQVISQQQHLHQDLESDHLQAAHNQGHEPHFSQQPQVLHSSHHNHQPVHDFQDIQQLVGQQHAAQEQEELDQSHHHGQLVDVQEQQEINASVNHCAATLAAQAAAESEIVISDVPVESRARASLPASYLFIEEISHPSHAMDVEEPLNRIFGVYARKSIPQRTQFGPVEGVIAQFSGTKPHSPQPNLIVFISDTLILDQSDENKSNWMRFVRMAASPVEQNLELVTKEQTHANPANANELITTTKFYFMTTKPISPREELKVWYSNDYAAKFRLKTLDEGLYKSLTPNAESNIQDHSMLDGSTAMSDQKAAMADLSTTTGGHKLRNKIAKSQQQQQLANKQVLPAPSISNDLVGNDCPTVAKSTSTGTTTDELGGTLSNPSTPSPAVVPTQYKCDTCGKAFPRFYSLRRHQVMHSGEKKYKCPICQMSFSHVYNRNRHVKRHSKLGNNRKQPGQIVKRPGAAGSSGKENDTTTNGQASESSGTFQAKKLGVDGIKKIPKPHRCGQCYKTFTSEERLSRHAIVHTSDERGKPLACTFCEKRFLNNSALSCHLKIHSTPKDQPRRYDCVLCKEVFECTQTRKEHIVTHSDPMTGFYSCPNCPKKFEEFAAVRKHIRAFHSDKQYPCSLCEKVFPRPDKLKLHMLRHSDHREFLCQSCGKQFKRKDKLKEHMQRMHAPDREAKLLAKQAAKQAQALSAASKKFIPKVSPTDYHRFIYKCHSCLLGFKRRGMLVNHLAKRHPETPPETVPELNLPILKTTRDYYCQYCDKIYKSSSKRKAHILKNHPGKSLPLSNRHKGGLPQVPGVPNPTYSATVGSVTTHPHYCGWCHKQYASKAKLLQHQRKKHPERSSHNHGLSSRPRPKVSDMTMASGLITSDQHMDTSQSEETSLATGYDDSGLTSLTNAVVDVSGDQMDMASHPVSTHNCPSLVSASPSLATTTSCSTQPIGSNVPVRTTPQNNLVSGGAAASNLITILGNMSSLNSIIATVNSDSVATADLHELLQANPAVANDLLTQAMSELTQGKAENGETVIAVPDSGVLWQ